MVIVDCDTESQCLYHSRRGIWLLFGVRDAIISFGKEDLQGSSLFVEDPPQQNLEALALDQPVEKSRLYIK